MALSGCTQDMVFKALCGKKAMVTERGSGMKRFIEEFKQFAFKGNMIELAVGMIIGSAFTSLVNSIVKDLVMPVISLVTGRIDFTNMFIPLAGQTTKVYADAAAEGAVLAYGSFLTQLIQFLIMALVVFVVVKQMNRLLSVKKAEEAPMAPKTKTCPYCKSEIALDATRCPHCTSQL